MTRSTGRMHLLACDPRVDGNEAGISLAGNVPKSVNDLLHPPPPPPQEPHHTIMRILWETPDDAYSADELAVEVKRHLSRSRGTGSLSGPFSSWDVRSALTDLVEAGVVAKESDGTTKHYYVQRRTSKHGHESAR